MMEPGTIINERYRVLGLLGEGGMGSVFEGEHTGVGRKVAIKVLHSTYAKNEEIVGRFEREARAAASIGHDNIIDVIDFGRHGEAPYMIMEFLKGESLGTRLEREGRLSVDMASHIMTQVLSALHAAHNVGIVHRDLKPDNVYLIQKGGVADYVKLLDFGISKFKSEQGGESKGLTQTGAMMGTPYYMAPEQALAKRDIDHRADIYSAGVMLYQMVTGTLPFHAESQAELLMAIVYQPFGITPPRQHNPELHPDFEAVILKAMCKDREGRFSSASEFAAALAQWSSGGLALPPDATGAMRRTGSHAAPSATPFEWQKSSGIVVPGAGPGGGTVAPSTGTALPVAPKRNIGPIIAVAGAVAVLAIVGGVVLLRSQNTAASSRTTASLNPPVPSPSVPSTATSGGGNASLPNTAALPPTTPTAPAAPTTSAVDIEGIPIGAVLTIDGQNTTVPHLTLPRGSAHTVRVTAPGMQPYENTFTVGDRDRTITVALVPVPVAPTQVAVAPPPPPPPQVVAVEHRPQVRQPRLPSGPVIGAPIAPPPTRTGPAPRGPLSIDTTY
jgi:serine/threonine-protein kinase